LKKGRKKTKVVEVNVQELEGIIDAAETRPLSSEEGEKLRSTLRLLIEQLGPGSRNSEKLHKIMEKLEKTREEDSSDEKAPKKKKKRKRGHGRNGSVKFSGAKKVPVPHGELKPGDNCPACLTGKVYPLKKPQVTIRFTGMAPVQATIYEMERLRCNLCGEIFTAAAPEDIGTKKYDETVPSVLATMIYGGGFPRYRLAGLQEKLGIPLPQSTQWGLLDQAAKQVQPAFDELVRQAAQGEVLYSDDTGRTVMKLKRPPGDTRTGVFTSGILSSSRDGPQIGLFFTGRQHAGENLSDVLQHRAAELRRPVAMSDALSRNTPKQNGEPMDVDQAHCLAHGRRYFVDAFGNFPEEAGHVLKALGEVFHNDDLARKEGLAPDARLEFHQEHSGPLMDKLHEWMKTQLDEKLVESNSGLGKALKYLLKHWSRLTLFLRKAGAPIDNNLAERALKKAVLHRKNSMFFRTERGAEVGDIFTSLIHTCELNGVNPFEYLTQLQRHSAEVEANPVAWMPWNCPGLPGT